MNCCVCVINNINDKLVSAFVNLYRALLLMDVLWNGHFKKWKFKLICKPSTGRDTRTIRRGKSFLSHLLSKVHDMLL